MSDQKQCPSACEGTPENAASIFLQAQDKISEGIDFSRLVFNAIEGMELDADLKSLSAGVYAIERKRFWISRRAGPSDDSGCCPMSAIAVNRGNNFQLSL